MERSEVSTSAVKWSEGLSNRVSIIIRKYTDQLKLAAYPLSYRVPVRERYGSTLLPATVEQHDQNCTQSH